jgi:hypothetical protein
MVATDTSKKPVIVLDDVHVVYQVFGTGKKANKAFIFEDDEVSELISSDYDLLLSAAGAIQTGIAPFGKP